MSAVPSAFSALKKLLQPTPRSGPGLAQLRGYFIATLFVVVAFACRILLIPIIGSGAHFVLFIIAVLAAGYLEGTGPGLFAVALGGTFAGKFVMLEHHPWSQTMFQILLFTIEGVVVNWLAQRVARAHFEAETTARLARQAEEDAKRAARIRDEFLSIASHELRTPLTSLNLQLQMAQMKVRPEAGVSLPVDKLAKVLAVSIEQVERLTRLVEELLDVTRIEAGKLQLHPEPMLLSPLVEEVCENFAHEADQANCRLEFQSDTDVEGCWDRGRLEQVLVNLLSNAIKYAPGKPIRIAVLEEGGYAVLEVVDGGTGIPKADREKIFERFERVPGSSTVSGLGLGLYIARQIVSAHDGTIEVTSSDRGSVFRVRLPRPPLSSTRTSP